jgi:hypothetical protein
LRISALEPMHCRIRFPAKCILFFTPTRRSLVKCRSFTIRSSAFDSANFVPSKCTCDIVAYGSAALNLGSCPHPQFQYVLELFRQIVPSIVIACRMRRKIVIDLMNAARAMCDNVIGLPPLILDLPPTNVTAS